MEVISSAFNSISILNKVTIIVMAISLPIILLVILRRRKFLFDIKQGKYPDAIVNFPIVKASPHTYLDIKRKVNNFIDKALSNQSTILMIDINDINILYSKGECINKYIPGKYLYYSYSEKDESIVEYYLEWLTFDLNPYYIGKRLIYFSKADGVIQQYFKDIERYEKPVTERYSNFEVSLSPLILFLLGVSDSPAFLPFKYSETSEYEKAIFVLGKVNDIQINNNRLICRI